MLLTCPSNSYVCLYINQGISSLYYNWHDILHFSIDICHCKCQADRECNGYTLHTGFDSYTIDKNHDSPNAMVRTNKNMEDGTEQMWL